jgi:hypothetical protein
MCTQEKSGPSLPLRKTDSFYIKRQIYQIYFYCDINKLTEIEILKYFSIVLLPA